MLPLRFTTGDATRSEGVLRLPPSLHFGRGGGDGLHGSVLDIRRFALLRLLAGISRDLVSLHSARFVPHGFLPKGIVMTFHSGSFV